MNWAYRITKRDKVAFALGSVFAIIILANWFASYSIGRVSNQFSEVYHDRLVPSLVISDVMERYYQNRLTLEDHILSASASKQDSLQQLVAANTQEIETLINQFEKTYLIERESAGLATYKKEFEKLVAVQDRILQLSSEGEKAEAESLYRTEGHQAFLHLLEPLHELIKLQGEVGKELYQSADRQVKTLKVLSYLVIGMSVFIALLVATLLQATRKLKNIKPQNYHLN
ncbi:MCP four helix bundle domain-containing protein [Pontibacter ramchanderi]|uniref:Chemoreceptor-like protein with four helix bundle sensory module n=1 Tax=Pontibacter ramchanderi TaxID=1179743 RepID=A0A2N3V1Y1_9BACT|nr:MCP four helix bundle domain-containing protein [Pontibacter ramchanderi]PKV75586.1 chemoreceptor-like protein with four helix bundle sensory module [Pontibacter ramchanderi]